MFDSKESQTHEKEFFYSSATLLDGFIYGKLGFEWVLMNTRFGQRKNNKIF